MSSLADVAARAGVSVSAASRVLSHSPSARVSATTRDKIFQAAADLDFTPNFAARALKLSKTRTVALIVPDLTNAIFSKLMRGVEDTALQYGYMVLLAHVEDMQPGGEMISQLIGEGRVDGVLVHPGDDLRDASLNMITARKLPIVLIHAERDLPISSVVVDDAAATRLATKHLIELGHRDIAFLSGRALNDSAPRRERGFREAMADAGVTLREELITRWGYEPEMGRRGARQLLSLRDRPTAFVVANLNGAIGALHEARVMGFATPEDVSIVAIHDAWTADHTWPPMTTVSLPLTKMGHVAFETLRERIEEGKIIKATIAEPPPQLILRESTGPVPVAGGP